MTLDPHCELILDAYRSRKPLYERLRTEALALLRDRLRQAGIKAAILEGRVKTEASLTGKLELKGHKYRSIDDITDIVGLRVVTYFSDEVDTVAALVEQLFGVDWDNSVDKRKMHAIDTFGYMSLHYICRLPAQADPELQPLRFEVQMRSLLQHAWANMQHDTGYKSVVEIPHEHQRSLNRLAGLLELADEQFSRIRAEITDYKRNVQALVASGNFDDAPLTVDTFRSYLGLQPFRRLAEKIASINQAELVADSLMPYYNVLQQMGMHTIGDVERMRTDCSDGAYQLALLQLAGTGLDIVALSVTIQNLCLVHLLRGEDSEAHIERMFDTIYGPTPYNKERARRICGQASKINLL